MFLNKHDLYCGGYVFKFYRFIFSMGDISNSYSRFLAAIISLCVSITGSALLIEFVMEGSYMLIPKYSYLLFSSSIYILLLVFIYSSSSKASSRLVFSIGVAALILALYSLSVFTLFLLKFGNPILTPILPIAITVMLGWGRFPTSYLVSSSIVSVTIVFTSYWLLLDLVSVLGVVWYFPLIFTFLVFFMLCLALKSPLKSSSIVLFTVFLLDFTYDLALNAVLKPIDIVQISILALAVTASCVLISGLGFVEKWILRKTEKLGSKNSIHVNSGNVKTPNRSLGVYAIEKWIGDGTFAHVYLARDRNTGLLYAVKVLKRDYAIKGLIDDFKREALMLLSLNHENIAKVIEVHIDPPYSNEKYNANPPYIVMEYMDGGSLRTLLKSRGKPLTVQEALRITLDICKALEYAHTRSPPILHLDVKPENIMFKIVNRGLLTKIVDFSSSVYASRRAVQATPLYASPEQMMGKALPQSDIYSLGLVLYEMLTYPLCRRYLEERAKLLLHGKILHILPQPRKLNKQIPEELEKIILKAINPNPTLRFNSISEFKAQIEQIIAPSREFRFNSTSR